MNPDPTDEVLPTQLGPPLHLKHTLPDSIDIDQAGVNRLPDAYTCDLTGVRFPQRKRG